MHKYTFPFQNKHVKMSSAKCGPLCSGPYGLDWHRNIVMLMKFISLTTVPFQYKTVNRNCQNDNFFYHWVDWKLSEWQFPVHSVIKKFVKMTTVPFQCKTASGSLHPRCESHVSWQDMSTIPTWESCYRCSRDKMAVISQTTFSNAFSWIKLHEFCLRFHWSLFLKF